VSYVRPRRPIKHKHTLKLKDADIAPTLDVPEKAIPEKNSAYFHLLSTREKKLFMGAVARRDGEEAQNSHSQAPASQPNPQMQSSPVAGWAAQFGFAEHMKEISSEVAELYGDDQSRIAGTATHSIPQAPYQITETPQPLLVSKPSDSAPEAETRDGESRETTSSATSTEDLVGVHPTPLNDPNEIPGVVFHASAATMGNNLAAEDQQPLQGTPRHQLELTGKGSDHADTAHHGDNAHHGDKGLHGAISDPNRSTTPSPATRGTSEDAKSGSFAATDHLPSKGKEHLRRGNDEIGAPLAPIDMLASTGVAPHFNAGEPSAKFGLSGETKFANSASPADQVTESAKIEKAFIDKTADAATISDTTQNPFKSMVEEGLSLEELARLGETLTLEERNKLLNAIEEVSDDVQKPFKPIRRKTGRTGRNISPEKQRELQFLEEVSPDPAKFQKTEATKQVPVEGETVTNPAGDPSPLSSDRAAGKAARTSRKKAAHSSSDAGKSGKAAMAVSTKPGDIQELPAPVSASQARLEERASKQDPSQEDEFRQERDQTHVLDLAAEHTVETSGEQNAQSAGPVAKNPSPAPLQHSSRTAPGMEVRSSEVLEMLALIREAEQSRDEAWRTLLQDREVGNSALLDTTAFLQRCVSQLLPRSDSAAHVAEVRNRSFGKSSGGKAGMTDEEKALYSKIDDRAAPVQTGEQRQAPPSSQRLTRQSASGLCAA
jgi:hypothetical protein